MTRHISQTFINKLQPTGQTITYWDDTIKGFGVRTRKQSMSYILKYRNKYGKQCLLTLGTTDKITKADFARNLAKEALASITQGKDPAKDKQEAKKEITIAELCDWYMREGTAHKKPSTLAIDRGRIERHIKPLIGSKIVKAVNRGDIERLLADIVKGDKIRKDERTKPRGRAIVRGGPVAGSRTVGLLGAIFEFAIARDIIQANPCHKVKKPQDKKREVFLTINEIQAFGRILAKPEYRDLHKEAVNILKLILLTGCRRNEVASLKWEYIDFANQCFHFPDTKTGQQTRPFGLGALHLLGDIRQGQKTGYVFPASAGNSFFIGTPRIFRRIRATKGQDGEYILKQGLTIHGLRHTFASLGADMGYSDFTIAGLLGHSLGTVTSRYTHAVDTSLIRACDNISLKIESALAGKTEQKGQIIDIGKVA